MTSQIVFLDLDQPRLEGIQFLSFGQLLSKETKIQREPRVSPWGICIQWAWEVVGGMVGVACASGVVLGGPQSP